MTKIELLKEAKKLNKKSPLLALEKLSEINLADYPEAIDQIEIAREYIFNYTHLHKYDEVLKWLDVIKKRLPEIEDETQTIYYHKIRGVVHMEKGEYSQGIDALQKALELAHQLKNDQIIYNETINLGVVFYNLQKYQQALEYLNHARKIGEAHNFDRTQLLMNLVAALSETGHLDEAISTGKELEEILKNSDNIIHQISCCVNLGKAHSKSGKLAEAIKYYQKAMDMAKQSDQEPRYYEIKYYLALVNIRSEKYLPAIPLLTDALATARLNHKAADEEKILNRLAYCYHKTGNYEKAYDNMEQAYNISKKINDENMQEKVARYQAKLEVEHNLNEKEQMMLIYSRQAEMGQMISAIAHQWRQPLNALSIILDSIYDAWEFNELSGDSLHTKIASGKELIYSMNNTIKDFRSFFQEKQQYDIFNVREVIEKAVRFTDYRFRDENIKLEFSIKDNCLLSGSSNQLLQVVLIILNNAFDAFANQDIPAPFVSIWHKTENYFSVIRIADNAGGIAPEIIEKIFDSSFSTKNSKENYGIGLYLAKMIIELKFKGNITVTNKNNGAVFTIKIPLPIK
jgi:signal transduction histidine kinase